MQSPAKQKKSKRSGGVTTYAGTKFRFSKIYQMRYILNIRKRTRASNTSSLIQKANRSAAVTLFSELRGNDNIFSDYSSFYELSVSVVAYWSDTGFSYRNEMTMDEGILGRPTVNTIRVLDQITDDLGCSVLFFMWEGQRVLKARTVYIFGAYFVTLRKPDSQVNDLLISKWSDKPYVPGAARLHNKAMHSLNGNIFLISFDDIKKLPSISQVLSTERGVMDRDGSISNLELVPGQLVADYYKIDKTLAKSRTVSMPATPVWPLKVRVFTTPTDMTTQNVVNTGPGYMTTASNWKCTNKLIDTPKAKILRERLESGTDPIEFWEKDFSGYLTLDVAGYASQVTTAGLSLEEPLLRLLLLKNILDLHKNSMVPESIYRSFDTSLEVETDNMEVRFNQKTQIVETPTTKQYPFLGFSGTLRFHVSWDAIERRSRPYAMVFPPMVLWPGREALNVALFVIMMSEWPFGIYTVHGKLKTSKQDVTFLPFANTVRVPGPWELDIIMPRARIEPIPSTIQEANVSVQFQPTYGPDHDPPYAAIGLTFRADEQRGVDILEYIWSWASVISAADILQFIGILRHSSLSIDRLLAVCNDIVVAACYRSPSLLTSKEVEIGKFFTKCFKNRVETSPGPDLVKNPLIGNTVFQTELRLLGRNVTPSKDNNYTSWEMTVPWLNDGGRAIFTHCFSLAAWNRVILNLGTNENLDPILNSEIMHPIYSPKVILLGVIQATTLSITTQTIWSSVGLDAGAMDAARICSAQHDFVESCFSTMACPAKMEEAFLRVFEHYFSYNLGFAHNTNWQGATKPVSIFGRFLKPSGFTKTLVKSDDNITTENINVPGTTIDVWYHLFTNKGIKAFANFIPLPNYERIVEGGCLAEILSGGTFGFTDNLVPIRCGDGRMGPYIDRINRKGYMNDNELPNRTDEQAWNCRLATTLSTFAQADFTGKVRVSNCNINPTQRLFFTENFVRLSPETTGYTTNATAATTLLPQINSRAELIYPFVDSYDRVALIMAELQKQPIPEEVWINPEGYSLSYNLIDRGCIWPNKDMDPCVDAQTAMGQTKNSVQAAQNPIDPVVQPAPSQPIPGSVQNVLSATPTPVEKLPSTNEKRL